MIFAEHNVTKNPRLSLENKRWHARSALRGMMCAACYFFLGECSYMEMY